MRYWDAHRRRRKLRFSLHQAPDSDRRFLSNHNLRAARIMIPTLGILGGTFDPIHYGHLRFANAVRKALGLARVNVIPTGIPPHRAAPFASPADRLAMTRLGCTEFPGLVPDDREVRRGGPSYTVVTLQELHNEDRTRPLALLLGTDA